LNLKNKGFSDFLRDFWLRHIVQKETPPKSLEIKIDQDNLRAKFSALNLDFNSASFDPLGSRSPPYERIKFEYPLQNTRFLLLSTNLGRERLQIDTELRLIIRSTADDLSRGTNIDDLERHWTSKIAGFQWMFRDIRCDAHLESEFSPKLLEIDQDNLRMKLNW